MSEFMDRAGAEAEQTIDHMGEGAWADGVRYGIYVGVASAAEQEPNAAEVEAAARVIVFQFDYGQRQWDDASEQARSQALYEARDALRAARNARLGRDE